MKYYFICTHNLDLFKPGLWHINGYMVWGTSCIATLPVHSTEYQRLLSLKNLNFKIKNSNSLENLLKCQHNLLHFYSANVAKCGWLVTRKLFYIISFLDSHFLAYKCCELKPFCNSNHESIKMRNRSCIK